MSEQGPRSGGLVGSAPERGERDQARELGEAIEAAQPIGGDERARETAVFGGRGGEPPDLEDWVADLNARYAVVVVKGSTFVLRETPGGAPWDRVAFMSFESFRNFLSNQFVAVVRPRKGLDYVPVAKLWLSHPRRRQYEGVEFEIAPGAARPDHFNLWQGLEFEPREGDCSRLVAHLHEVICGGDAGMFAWVLQWFAHLVQKPWERIGTALVLRGGQGAGKTIVGTLVGELLGAHYMLVDQPGLIVGAFNAHMASLVLLHADESFWAGDKAAEGRLKSLVTAATQPIQPKGVDTFQVKNFVRLFVTSNERWVVPAGLDERRFAVFDVKPTRKQDHAYFAAIEAEWRAGGREAFLHLLLEEPLTLNLRKIPRTEALLEQKLNSADPMVKWWFGRLQDGAQTRDAIDEWKGWVATKALYADYLKFAQESGVRRPGDDQDLGHRIRDLCPGVAKRRFPHGAPRPWGYRFPHLATARAGFEGVVGQTVEWPAEDGAPAQGEDEPLD